MCRDGSVLGGECRRRIGLGGTVMVTPRLKRHGMVATRYDGLAVRYKATVLVTAINEWL